MVVSSCTILVFVASSSRFRKSTLACSGLTFLLALVVFFLLFIKLGLNGTARALSEGVKVGRAEWEGGFECVGGSQVGGRGVVGAVELGALPSRRSNRGSPCL